MSTPEFPWMVVEWFMGVLADQNADSRISCHRKSAGPGGTNAARLCVAERACREIAAKCPVVCASIAETTVARESVGSRRKREDAQNGAGMLQTAALTAPASVGPVLIGRFVPLASLRAAGADADKHDGRESSHNERQIRAPSARKVRRMDLDATPEPPSGDWIGARAGT